MLKWGLIHLLCKCYHGHQRYQTNKKVWFVTVLGIKRHVYRWRNTGTGLVVCAINCYCLISAVIFTDDKSNDLSVWLSATLSEGHNQGFVRVTDSYFFWYLLSYLQPRSGELRTQNLKSHLLRTQSLNVLPLKPGEGQYIAIRATLTARDFFLAYFYTSVHSPAFFPKPLPIFHVLVLASTWFLCRPAE